MTGPQIKFVWSSSQDLDPGMISDSYAMGSTTIWLCKMHHIPLLMGAACIVACMFVDMSPYFSANPYSSSQCTSVMGDTRWRRQQPTLRQSGLGFRSGGD